MVYTSVQIIFASSIEVSSLYVLLSRPKKQQNKKLNTHKKKNTTFVRRIMLLPRMVSSSLRRFSPSFLSEALAFFALARLMGSEKCSVNLDCSRCRHRRGRLFVLIVKKSFRFRGVCGSRFSSVASDAYLI